MDEFEQEEPARITIPTTVAFGYRNPRNAEAVFEGAFGDELMSACPELIEMSSGGASADGDRTELAVTFTFATDVAGEAERLFTDEVEPSILSYDRAPVDDDGDHPERAVLSVSCGDPYAG